MDVQNEATTAAATSTRSLVEVIQECIASDKILVPAFSSIALQVQREASREEFDLRKIEQLIMVDQGLSSQVLRIANSAFYRGLSEATTIKAAILRLGVKEFCKIIMIAATKQNFVSKNPTYRKFYADLWKHSVGCALGTSWISKRVDLGVPSSTAFFAGLFHDIGKLYILIILEHLQKQNAKFTFSKDTLLEAVQALHAAEGGRLIEKWNFPKLLVETVLQHHVEYSNVQQSLLILAVRVADAVCSRLGMSLTPESKVIIPAMPETIALGLTELDIVELEIALEDTALLA